MKIEINKKKHEIKPASELTVKEYIDFFSKISPGAGNFEALICYISVITGLDYQDIDKIDIDNNSIRRLSAYVGKIYAPNEFQSLDYFYHKKTGKRIYKASLNWRTMGVRKLIEERKTENQLELAVYLLAVYVAGNYDNEKIEEIYNELMAYNAASVYGFIIFFFKGLLTGRKSGNNFFKRLKKKAFTSIAKLLSK